MQVGAEGTSFESLTSQITSGGPLSAFGRAVDDLGLDQTFYLVPSEPQRPRLVSQTLIQNAIVLQTGTFGLPVVHATPEPTGSTGEIVVKEIPTPTPQPQQAQVPTAVPTAKPPDVITIIVKPQDAVTLNYLLFSGAQLSLALRNPEDDSTSNTQAVTLDFLLGEYSITLPVKLPYGIEPRVDELVAPILANDVPKVTVIP
jgi:pilus assembly protein CpaB